MNDSLVKKGDRFRIIKDIDTQALTTWGAWTGGYDCTIPEGTIIVADHDQVSGANAFSAIPENYKEIEEMVIPEENRKHQYGDYHLVFLQSDIGDKLIELLDLKKT
jgi:hypothetical protein